MKSFSLFTWFYAPAALVIASVILLSRLAGKPIGDFTRDPAAVIGFSPLIGLLSNLGILLWCATASCCFFAAVVLKSKDRERALFFFFSGLLTTLLLFDDFFLFHERVFVKLFHLEEVVTLLIYAILVLIYLIRFRKLWIKSKITFFILALFFFTTSIIIDFAFVATLFWHYLLEDGAKFFGIVSWFGYFTQYSVQAIMATDLPISSN